MNQQITLQVGPLGGIVVLSNVLVAGVVGAALWADQGSAAVAVVAAAGYYTLSTLTTVWVLSGSATTVIVERQRQTTERRKLELHYALLDDAPIALRPAEALQIANGHDVDGLQAPSYVAPVDRTAERNALEWARSLYGLDGQPDARRVVLDTEKEEPGRLRVRKPGAKELEVLLHYRILRPIYNGDRLTGYRLHLALYPTREAIEGILLRGRGG